MSRIGKKAIKLKDKVEIQQQDHIITLKGPKGELSIKLRKELSAELKDDHLHLKIDDPGKNKDKGKIKALYGLYGSLLNNASIGVSEGFSKTLLLVGVGYRAQMKDKTLVMLLGYSHPVEMDFPEGITIECPEQTKIVVSGVDKELVGGAAACIRAARPPEVYKGKGILYQGEIIRRKAGKAGKK